MAGEVNTEFEALSHITCRIRMKRVISECVACCLHFTQACQGLVLPIVNMGLPTSSHLNNKIPHRYAQKFISWES